jgi:hypothetical protein
MSKITIKKIQFFTPATITYEENSVISTCGVSVDYVGKVVQLSADAPPEIADLFFPFLDESLAIPEGFFEANDEVYEKASKANDDYEKIHKDHVGGGDA